MTAAPLIDNHGRFMADDGPGLGVDELKRKEVGNNVFETSLSIDQCKRILRATKRRDINFRRQEDGGRTLRLVESMKLDRWVWTDADPIRLHLDVGSGEVVCSDGQHRLYAAVVARRVLRTLVLWGDTWKAGVHVDTNKVRNIAQFLAHEHGLQSATVYVAMARLHLARLMAVEQNLGLGYCRAVVTEEAIIDFILANKNGMLWAINRGAIGAGYGLSMTGYAVFLFELYSGINERIAEEFHTDLMNKDLPMSDPLAQLRRSAGRRYNDTGIRATVGYTINNLVKAHALRSAGETQAKWVNVNSDDVVLPAGFKRKGVPA